MKPISSFPANDQVIESYELQRIAIVAANFVTIGGGNSERAINVLDEVVDLLLDAGVLSMWHYRLLLAAIRGQAHG